MTCQHLGDNAQLVQKKIFERVLSSTEEEQRMSIRRRSFQLNVSRTSLYRIMSRDLHQCPYKIHLVQEIKPRDYENRFNLARAAGKMFSRCKFTARLEIIDFDSITAYLDVKTSIKMKTDFFFNLIK